MYKIIADSKFKWGNITIQNICNSELSFTHKATITFGLVANGLLPQKDQNPQLMEYFKSISKVFQKYFKSISRVFQKYFKSISKVFQKYFKSISKVFQKYFKSYCKTRVGT